MTRYLPVAGLFTGAALLSLSVYLYALTPVLVLALAGVTAVSSRSRPFAWGALAAAAGGFLFLVIFLGIESVIPPGTEFYSGH